MNEEELSQGGEKIFLLFCTPKAAARLELHKLPEPYNGKVGIEVCPTHMIYMNMASGWTEAECDDICYLVEKEQFLANANITFRRKE
jgi:hypothetical protein